jgi:hypothetical protein
MTKPKRGRKRRAPSPPRVSVCQLAKRLGVTEGAIRKRMKAVGFSEAAIARGPNGRPVVMDADLAAREWQANRAKPTPDSLDASRGPRNTARPQTLTEAQIRVHFQREVQLELANLQKRGLLIDAAVERRRDFERNRMARDAMFNLADRVAPLVAAESDPIRCHRIIIAETRVALAALADVFDAEDDAGDSGHGGADAA